MLRDWHGTRPEIGPRIIIDNQFEILRRSFENAREPVHMHIFATGDIETRAYAAMLVVAADGRVASLKVDAQENLIVLGSVPSIGLSCTVFSEPMKAWARGALDAAAIPCLVTMMDKTPALSGSDDLGT